jgi:NAD(P)-dependent dehydrogenase (short-subunit alcohol dehydrogenase family)
MRIAVIDGQGGGIGSAIIRRLKDEYGEKVEIWALGSNAIATAAMMKARANRGATGENAIIRSVARVEIVIGTISVVMAHAMMGELTPAMAEAIAASPARKLLIPLTQENLTVVGVQKDHLPVLIDNLIPLINEEMATDV